MKPEDLEDFLKDDAEDDAISVDKAKASRIQVEYDEDMNQKRTWEPGSEDKFVEDIEKLDKEVTYEIDDEGEEEPTKKEPEEEEEEAPQEEKEEEKPKVKEGSRSQERIRQLARENREKAAIIEQERQEKLALQTAYMKTMLTAITSDITQAEQDLKRAMEDQDSELFAKAQRKLIEAQSQKMSLEQAVTKGEEALKAAPRKDTKITSDDVESDNLPEAAREWLKTKDEYMSLDKYKTLPKDIRKHILPVRQATFEIANQLKAEGYTPDEEYFYEELDLRLGAKFDFYDELASLGIDGVDFSSIGTKKASPSDETLKPQKKTTKEKAARVPVAASSSSSNAKGKTKTSVTLHPDQLALFNSAVKPRYLAQGYTEEQALKAFINLYKESQ